jgi:hypothetical protein
MTRVSADIPGAPHFPKCSWQPASENVAQSSSNRKIRNLGSLTKAAKAHHGKFCDFCLDWSFVFTFYYHLSVLFLSFDPRGCTLRRADKDHTQQAQAAGRTVFSSSFFNSLASITPTHTPRIHIPRIPVVIKSSLPFHVTPCLIRCTHLRRNPLVWSIWQALPKAISCSELYSLELHRAVITRLKLRFFFKTIF